MEPEHAGLTEVVKATGGGVLCAPDDPGALADALEALLVKMPERGMYDNARPATLRFIAGLRVASAAGEPVVFG